MSTRCQVHVRQHNVGWDAAATLYHHCDGYPSGMVPLFVKAWEQFKQDWEAERAGKVASMLCSVDPTGFEVEESHELHGDIEWYYRLTVERDESATTTRIAVWTLEVFLPNSDSGTKDEPGVLLGTVQIKDIDGGFVEGLENKRNEEDQ